MVDKDTFWTSRRPPARPILINFRTLLGSTPARPHALGLRPARWSAVLLARPPAWPRWGALLLACRIGRVIGMIPISLPDRQANRNHSHYPAG